MYVGYARVSSFEQDIDLQVDRLRDLCEKVYQEKESGMRASRPQLEACLDFIREGDTLIITRLDRLARSTVHLCALDALLTEKGVTLKVLDQNIDTTSSHGRALFGMLAVFAQFEHDLRKERQMEGIRKAQAQGKHFGRTKRLTMAQIEELQQLRREGMPVALLRIRYGMTRTSIYRYLARHPEKGIL